MNSKCALLVIDMQLVAFDGRMTPPIANGERLLGATARLIDGCRKRSAPIVYVQTSAPSGRPYAPDVHGWEIHPSLSPRSGDRVVTKRNSSGFDATDLADVLNELAVDKVIVCGVWSQFCVTSTSLDAAALGLEVLVAADAHGTVAPDADQARRIVHEVNERLVRAGVAISTIRELLAADD